ncbi:SIR2 family NAD-dependent protein deacylase [Marinoscillum furvescens]|uniref:NAD-dependent protein deacylase n=1 Tax=Marinoscillum furvescens DSM 4134 TaxID=1122208 RepID=A0A3D9KX66_MARFU|nr:NAD-dependent deacylase [Marinoscillum furvescens]RED93360.1 NAD-dependent deacetylase [Marinoscillum furvescens DSM 4134]
MKKIAVLTGAGISAESGISTFRDAGGLWEGHDIMDVASPHGWHKNPELVLDFYNKRRRQAINAKPNAGHLALADLEKYFEVHIITQNIDNLHEKAGSFNVLHLHGELFKSQCSRYSDLIYDIQGTELCLGDMSEKGFQLRPHVVWFGEAVPMIEPAAQLVSEADVVIVVGTSMVVYPAAGLIQYARPDADLYLVDPKIPDFDFRRPIEKIQRTAASGLPDLVQRLISRIEL